MDREQIIELAHEMKTKEDLLSLLNLVKQSEMEKVGLVDKFYPFTMRLLNYYCNPNNTLGRYKQFEIAKKTGGVRLITAPKNKSFMLMLDCLNEIFKALYTPSDYAMGFTEGRSVVNNADVHKGQNYILNIDLKDFFPSIEQPRVWKRLQLKPFNFPIPVANLVAGLCSMKEEREMEDGSKKYFYVLPQGAPTSPIITNMICDNLDRRLAGLSKRFGLRYTRYADDITFSSMHYVYKNEGEFWTELKRIVADQGFRINDKKTRLQKLGSRQEVTGIIVSNKLNVAQKYVRDIRNILYMWDRYGYGVAYNKFFAKYKKEKGHVKHGNPDMINVLEGKLLYLKMVKGEDDSVYLRLFEKFLKLAGMAKDITKTTIHNITYVETIPVEDFEKNNGVTIIITTSLPKTNNDVVEPGHRYAYYEIEGKKIFISVNKDVTPDIESDKAQLSISICRDAKGVPFRLLHKTGKITVPLIKEVNIDELNNELDTLLSI